MPNTLSAASTFLVTTLFDLYIFIMVIRVILVWAGANYYHPFTQFVVKLTQPIVTPLRRLIPNRGRVEFASIALILFLEFAKFFLLASFNVGIPHISGIVLLAFADTIKLILNAFLYGIFLQVILSWVQPYSPLNHVLTLFISPIMRPIQRVIPPIAGFDISPIPAIIGLQLLTIVVVNPLMIMGTQWALNS